MYWYLENDHLVMILVALPASLNAQLPGTITATGIKKDIRSLTTAQKCRIVFIY
jgi:hypothetical protein